MADQTEETLPGTPVMFDTNIFNLVLDGQVDYEGLVQGAEVWVTAIQMGELRNTKNDERRSQLLQVVKEIDPIEGKAGGPYWDQAVWGGRHDDDETLGDKIKRSLGRLRRSRGNRADAEIASNCITNGFVLATGDKNLAKAAREHGCKVLEVVCPQPSTGQPIQ